jgi:hypothetical protein
MMRENSSSPCQRGRHRRPHPCAGHTLIEAVFYLGIILVVSAPIVSSTLVGTDAVAQTDGITRLQERNRSSLVRLVGDVRASIADTLVVSNTSLAFTLAKEFDGAVIVPGDSLLYELDSDPTDPVNGKDDNGNGLVDEGRLVRTNQTTGDNTVLCSGVNLQGSRFEPIDGGVDVILSCRGGTKRDQYTMQVTRSVAVFSRN